MLVFINCIALSFIFEIFSLVSGHVFALDRGRGKNPSGKCGDKSHPITQIGRMHLHPCNKIKVVLQCPIFASAEDIGKCGRAIVDNSNSMNATVPFKFKAYDEFDSVNVVIERGKEVKFIQFFVEARRVHYGVIDEERFGRFFDKDIRNTDIYTEKQCHEDACCEFVDVPDVAMHCQRPWDGPNRLVGNIWEGDNDQFSWEIPAGYYGDVIFVGTFITSSENYWSDVHSNILTFKRPGRMNPRIGYIEESNENQTS